MKRTRCNFNLPKPFVIQSTKALKRNGFRKYVIYPDLERFKRACLRCGQRYEEGKRSYCRLDDKDFMLKFYGIDEKIPQGIFLGLGSVPLSLGSHPLRVEVEAYLFAHSQKSKRKSRPKTINGVSMTGRKDGLALQVKKVNLSGGSSDNTPDPVEGR